MGLQETIFVNKLRSLGITRQQLSVLTGIRPQILVPGLNGSARLGNSEIQKIASILDELQKLFVLVRPFCLPNDVGQLEYLLAQMKIGRLDNVMSPVAREISDEMRTLCLSA